ncbi:LutC/YkgG family protein [Georgenia deserti]|uniref:Lactate utilization protein C n=1 Tax=Georgenia deserti TaxID=2093781 RepID=A0ABW4L032_9MICO
MSGMDAREAVLARVRDALSRSQDGPPAPVPRTYRTGSGIAPGTAEAIDLLIDRLVDYRAQVHRCAAGDLASALGDLAADASSVVVPSGLDPGWRDAVADRAEILTDTAGAPLDNTTLDGAGAVLTAARVAIAESGTIVLDAQPDQGRRAISLVPDRHICVLRAKQIVATVPEAVAILGEHPQRPLTWIAGPSATSDIELVRVEGVHGPRTLDVVIAGGRD